MSSSSANNVLIDATAFKRLAAQYCDNRQSKFQYGTAGFRMRANLLDPVMFTVGILAALRSKKLDGKVIGVMVTASHNPPEDNGVKLVDPRGEMLEASWEGYATTLANATNVPQAGDSSALLSAIQKIVEDLNIDLSKPANIVFARDTRASGERLVQALVAGFQAIPSTEYLNSGVLTTPILHYLVRCKNTLGTSDAYGVDTEEGYYEKISAAFKKLVNKPSASGTTSRTVTGDLYVDCANGVGYISAQKFAAKLEGYLNIIPVNTDIENPQTLNSGCGADFVKTKQKLPSGVSLTPNQRACSLDGDADRLMYYFVDEDGATFRMLDGDKIASLVAGYLGELVKSAGIDEAKLGEVGVVQTAYANGASTRYLTERVPVQCVPTGVKHLHHAAERYAIGVYFEANGHGTVLFSPSALQTLQSHQPKTPAQKSNHEHLLAFTDLINQTVGDALSDMLFVEAVLAHKGYGVSEWNSLYTDLPNRLVAVRVPDRNAFTTEDAERRLVSPPGLQAKLDDLMHKYNGGRSFVRPSGTEDAVRVYAEATNRAEADELAFKVAGLVYDEAGGDPAKRPREYL